MSFTKFDTGGSSRKTARVVANRYCEDSSLSYVFARWFACGGGRCAEIYGAIYDQANNKLVHIDQYSTPGRYGGSKVHACSIPGVASQFTCYYVNWNDAGGTTSSLTQTPLEGAYPKTPSPLAKPYYVFTTIIGDDTFEWRVWMKQDTGYSETLGARRRFGVDSRSNLRHTDSARLRDETRGVCSID